MSPVFTLLGAYQCKIVHVCVFYLKVSWCTDYSVLVLTLPMWPTALFGQITERTELSFPETQRLFFSLIWVIKHPMSQMAKQVLFSKEKK